MQQKWVILTSCAATAQTSAPGSDIVDGNEIIVTTGKRAEKLQDVPTAITNAAVIRPRTITAGLSAKL